MSGLYTQDILRLAAASAAYPRLSNANGSAERLSPTCGSRIIADVQLDQARHILAYGHEVRACALGQASSALLAQQAIGRSRQDITDLIAALDAYLRGLEGVPKGWTGLDVFAPARDYPARHAAIVLPFMAVADAMRGA